MSLRSAASPAWSIISTVSADSNGADLAHRWTEGIFRNGGSSRIMTNNSFWQNKRVCVTGGAGFLGSFVTKKLQERGAKEIFIPTIEKYDLVQIDSIKQMFDDCKPDIVIHLAAMVGGIGANLRTSGGVLLRQPDDGCAIDPRSLEARSGKVCGAWHYLRLPQVHPHPFQGR